MEGCSKYCSYCVVPYTRGEEFSRPLNDVLTEIAGLAQQGVKEINLLGQNVNAYRGEMENGEICDFATLLRIVHEIPGIERLRFTTSHPREFTDAIIECYRDLPKLVSHLHLPIQSGSDRVLSAMKRGYTALEYKSIIRKLRAIRPDLCLSSDFIVGFPGETEREFEQTLKLVKDIAFDLSFVFIYSPRPGTPAANLHDDTPHEEKSAPSRSFERSHRSRNRAHQPNHGRHGSTLLGRRHFQKRPQPTASPYRQQPRGQLYRHTRHDQPNDRFGNHRSLHLLPERQTGISTHKQRPSETVQTAFILVRPGII